MADFKVIFVAAILLYFSCSFLTGSAQQYEEDYSAEVRFANWQSTKTSKTRNGDAPSPFDVKNSSPDLTTRSRPRTRNGHDREVTPQYKNQEEPLQRRSETVRQRPRTQHGIRPLERRADEVTEVAIERRRPSRARTVESSTSTPEPIKPRLRVPLQETPVKLPKGFSLENRRQRIKQESNPQLQRITTTTSSTIEASSLSSPRPFSRGRTKAKLNEHPRKSVKKDDDISESDNYPPGFIEKLKNADVGKPSADEGTGLRRSRLKQRAAKTYPSIAISEANRFRQRYPRIQSSTEKSREEVTTQKTTTRRNDPRQRSRSRYTTSRTTTEKKPKQFRGYSRRVTTTEKIENSTQVPITTFSYKNKHFSKLRTSEKITKTTTEKIVTEGKKEEALEPAENLFYVYPENGAATGRGADSKQKMKNVDRDLEPEASEEDKTLDTSKATEKLKEMTSTAGTATIASTATTATTPATLSTPATAKEPTGASPSTRHRFSSRFNRSNKTTILDDVTTIAPALVADIPSSSPINLTSLFDEAPDSTLSVMNLFNNSFAASSTATNKTIFPESKTTTTRPSTVTVNSSTNSQTNTTTKRTKKKSQNKKQRKSNKATTASPASALNDRPILRGLASLFAGPETNTKRNGERKKTSRTTTSTKSTTTTTPATATTSSTTTPRPQEISEIQSFINETMELVQHKTATPAPIQAVPRVALNALTPETSIEELTTQPTSSTTSSSTTVATSTTTTTSTSTTTSSTTSTTSTTTMTSSPKRNCTSQFVFFDYNSTAPIPKQFAEARKMTATTPSTTTSTTADYFVYGVYPNNTIVRKRAFKAFDYEKYHSPYVIFGIYPNNTIVKKFPNGTIINDEYMTSDNEIKDIMSGFTQKTTSTSESTARKEEVTTTAMQMAGSETTKTSMDDETTTAESPDSMFEILENQIENEEGKDEELTVTTETYGVENSEFEAPQNITTESTGETSTGVPFKFLEDIEGTTADSSITTESNREGKSFYPNDIFSEEVLESTTEKATEGTTNSRESTTYASSESIAVSTTESSREGKSFFLNDLFGENVVESTTQKAMESTTNSVESTTNGSTENIAIGTTENSREDKSFFLNDISGEEVLESTTEKAAESTTNSRESTTYASSESIAVSTTESSREGKSFFLNDLFGENVVESTTQKAMESTTNSVESTTNGSTENIAIGTTENSREGKSFLVNDVFNENILDSTTERVATTTENSTDGKSFFFFFGGGEIERTTQTTVTTESDRDKLLSFNEVLADNTVVSTTESTAENNSSDEVGENIEENTTYRNGVTTENNFEAFSLDLNSIFGHNIVDITTENAGGTTEANALEQTDGNTTKGTTTESSVESNSGFERNIVESTTDRAKVTSENNTEGKFLDTFDLNAVDIGRKNEDVTGIRREGNSLVLNDFSSGKILGTTTEDIQTQTNTENNSSINDNWFESTTEKSATTTESTSSEQIFAKFKFDSPTVTERIETRTVDSFDILQLFQPTTTRYDSSLSNFDIRLGDGPVYRPSTTEAVEVSTAARYIFGLYGDSVVSSEVPATRSDLSTTTEASTTLSEQSLSTTQAPKFAGSEFDLFSSTDRRNSDETTTNTNTLNEVPLFDAELFQQPDIKTGNTKSTVEQDEPSGLVNLAYRALGSSDTITPSPNYITSTMKSMNYAEKKVRLKMKKKATSTSKPENVFIVTPETNRLETDFEFTKKGRVKFVTLTPGVILTTNFRDGNDVMTMSSQHVQKVTKAPAYLPDNILKSVVGEIQEKSSSPIPDIIKNVEKELQGNGISVSLARRIIEMAIERSVTTSTPQTTETTPYFTTAISTTAQPTTVSFTTPASELITVYNELLNTVNVNPLSIGFAGDYTNPTQTTPAKKDDVRAELTTTTFRTTTKSSKKTKSSRNSAAMSTLSQNDKLLLEAILKQQNSDLSVQEIDKIIENQIRLAEEVRKASKNLKKKPRLTTTTTTTTTTQTPPLFGFLISLFSGNSSPSNFPVTRAPIKQTRSRVKSSRVRGSMTNTPKSINPDPLKEADEGNSSGERSTRGELVTAAIDVTKAVSKFMGTFLSSAAQSFQAFFSNFGKGR